MTYSLYRNSSLNFCEFFIQLHIHLLYHIYTFNTTFGLCLSFFGVGEFFSSFESVISELRAMHPRGRILESQ